MKNKKIRREIGKKTEKRIFAGAIASLFIFVITFFLTVGIFKPFAIALLVFFFIQGFFYARDQLENSTRIKKMEEVFPDFLQLMSSNLRAGMTVDKSLLLSSRKEFDPLDKEILNVGKEIITGKEIETALRNMSDRINSEKIGKTINLLISGIRSGGNLAILLEETAANMRERNFVEKKAASNVLMYMIFIFFAIAVGAPILFSLSSVLVEVLTSILSNLPDVSTTANSLPFTITKINVSVEFIIYFSLIFIVSLDILGSLVIGLVSKGEEKAGTKYVIPLMAISLSVFFIVRKVLSVYLSEFF